MELDERLIEIHRRAAAFAGSTNALGAILRAAADFSAGWGARPPVAGAVYRMQTDLFALATRIEGAFRGDGFSYIPGGGWNLPAGYPLAPLAAPWQEIPSFQAVSLPALFRSSDRDGALAVFETGGICSLATAFSAAVDAAVAGSSQ